MSLVLPSAYDVQWSEEAYACLGLIDNFVLARLTIGIFDSGLPYSTSPRTPSLATTQKFKLIATSCRHYQHAEYVNGRISPITSKHFKTSSVIIFEFVLF
jgi:hypothetical protein